MPESVQSCFELSIHFPVFFSRELFLVAVHGWFAIQTNVLKLKLGIASFKHFIYNKMYAILECQDLQLESP